MRTTIFDAIVSVEPDGTLALRENRSAGDLAARVIFGIFPFGIGALVTYVFVSGNGPRPMGGLGQHVLGCVAIALFVAALGVVPIYAGLATWFIGREHLMSLPGRQLESSVRFAGMRLWRRLHPLAGFEHVLIWRGAGRMFGRGYWTVSCEGPSGRVDLAEFRESAAAEKLAEEIGKRVGLMSGAPCSS